MPESTVQGTVMAYDQRVALKKYSPYIYILTISPQMPLVFSSLWEHGSSAIEAVWTVRSKTIL